MTTNAIRPAGGNRNAQLEQATALKALIGSASLALTLAGWALLSHQQAGLDTTASTPTTPAAQADVALDQTTIAEPTAPPVADALPTLAPLYTPRHINIVRPAQATGVSQVAAPKVAAPKVAAPKVAAPVAAPQAAAPQPQLRTVTAPPRPVAVTRSSR